MASMKCRPFDASLEQPIFSMKYEDDDKLSISLLMNTMGRRSDSRQVALHLGYPKNR